jgi:8-oxo-dGTP pyrophosphatase MutT (NUDIX family)
VAFPGGKREPADPSPWATATREAEEEVGIDPASVRPLGELSPLRTRTGYQVHPCVAGVPEGLQLRVDTREFESVFFSPLELFAERERFRLLLRRDAAGSRLVPCYRLEQGEITGVTAAVLAQLANVAYDAGIQLRREPGK